MGESWRKKCPHSKVDGTLTVQHISMPNCKRAANDDDPYGAGEQSGKRAKPDARSAAAKTRARAAEAVPKPEPLPSQLPPTHPPPPQPRPRHPPPPPPPPPPTP